MKELKQLRSNLSTVVVFNGILIIVNVGLSLLLPKFLSVTEYGLYRLFTFYIVYSSFMHFGFLDGFYVKYGVKSLEDEKDELLTDYFSSFVIFQSVLMILSLIVLNLLQIEHIFVWYAIVIDMVLMNIIYFFHYYSQLSNKFKIYSIMFIFTKTAVLITLIVFYLLGDVSSTQLILVNLFANVLIIFVYYINQKQFKFVPKFTSRTYFDLVRSGFPIFMGNIAAFLIMGLDRFSINLVLSLDDFSYYSFAYSIIGMFIILITAMSRVSYPFLAKLPTEKSQDIKHISSLLITIFYCFLLIFVPVGLFIVNLYLPDYSSSLALIVILMPIIIYKSDLDIIVNTSFKFMNFTKSYFWANIGSLISGAILFVGVIVMRPEIKIMAIATVLVHYLWYLISDIVLMIKIKKYEILKHIAILAYTLVYYYIMWNSIEMVDQMLRLMFGFMAIFGIIVIMNWKKLNRYYKIIRKGV